MKYNDGIWNEMAARAMTSYDRLMAGAAKMGFKFKKGEVKVPESLVRELVRDSYKLGAKAALDMAAEVDGEG